MSDTTRTVDLSVKPEVTPFFDTLTNTVSYVVRTGLERLRRDRSP